MSIICPNKSSQEYKDLVKELGSDALAYVAWNKDIEVNKPLTVQSGNLNALQKGEKTISVRNIHDYKVGDVLDVFIKNKKQNIKVQVESINRVEDFTKLPISRKDDFARALGDYKNFEDLKSSNDYTRENSPLSVQYPEMYKFITGQIPSDIIKYGTIKEEFMEGSRFVNPFTKVQYDTEAQKLKEKFEKKHKVTYVYLTRRLKRLESDLEGKNPQSEAAIRIQQEIDKLNQTLEEVKKTQSAQSYIDLGTDLLDGLKSFLKDLESGKTKLKPSDLNYAREVLDVFDTFDELRTDSAIVRRDLQPFIDDFMEDYVNKFSTRKEKLTIEDIEEQNTDINRYRKGVGALADVHDYLGSTIGAMIKAAQNEISTENKKLTTQVQEEVDALKEYAKKNNIKIGDMYNIFQQELYNTTVLTKEFTSEYYNKRNEAFKNAHSTDSKLQKEGKAWLKTNTYYDESGRPLPTNKDYYNKDYIKIQKTPELKRFYDFHQQLTFEAKKKLPISIGNDFIANIKSSVFNDVLTGNKGFLAGLKEGIKNIINVKE